MMPLNVWWSLTNSLYLLHLVLVGQAIAWLVMLPVAFFCDVSKHYFLPRSIHGYRAPQQVRKRRVSFNWPAEMFHWIAILKLSHIADRNSTIFSSPGLKGNKRKSRVLSFKWTSKGNIWSDQFSASQANLAAKVSLEGERLISFWGIWGLKEQLLRDLQNVMFAPVNLLKNNFRGWKTWLRCCPWEEEWGERNSGVIL